MFNLSKNAKIDLSIIFVVNVIAFIIFAKTDTLEAILAFVSQYEQYEIDELITLLFSLSLSAAYFSFRRASEASKLIHEIEQISSNDLLTKLYNRRYMQKQLDSEIARSRQNISNFTIILIELDNFKQINETYGQSIGDRILIRVAEILVRNIKTIDCIARWGSKEFLILCPETETQDAIGVTSKLLQYIRQIKCSGVNHLTASFGLTSFRPEDNVESIINRVNSGLHKAKKQGKNRFITIV